MPTIPSEEQDQQQKQSEHLLEGSDSLVQLASDLWIDLDGGVVIREQERLLLTAREVNVLRILVQAWHNGRQYISAQAIADRIHLDIYNPEHSIEQSISLLRRKLGETPHRAHILRGRRGFGYRLFAETKPDI